MAIGNNSQPIVNPLAHLPRELPRPVTFREVDPQKIVEIDPGLANIPHTFLRMFYLDMLWPTFAKAIDSVIFPQMPNDFNTSRPTTIDVRLVRDSYFIIPTHILAVTSMQRDPRRTKVDLYPIHSLMVALQCANLPTIPPVIPAQGSSQSTRLPLMWLDLPHPESFKALLVFLYCGNPLTLVEELMPIPPRSTLFNDRYEVVRYATRLATTPDQAVGLVNRVRGLWENICALEIHNDDLWMTIDTLWEAVVSALRIVTQRRRQGLGGTRSASAVAG